MTTISADLISEVTDSVMTAVIEWQNRSLDKVYPILIMDALVVKVRDFHLIDFSEMSGNFSYGQVSEYIEMILSSRPVKRI